MTDKPFRPLAKDIPGQKLPYPAKQSEMTPPPADDLRFYKAAGKLAGKKALITGGDSGIGRSVALGYAKEGADVAIVYNVNDDDANRTRELVEAEGRRCLLLKGDVCAKKDCEHFVATTCAELGGLNILVNNAHYQMAHGPFAEVPEEDLRRHFDTNILGYMFMAQAALPHLK
ncbi:MAG: SDR family NAD(P)-dependent oxidoreductase, partial [Proteobacteria bacterium]